MNADSSGLSMFFEHEDLKPAQLPKGDLTCAPAEATIPAQPSLLSLDADVDAEGDSDNAQLVTQTNGNSKIKIKRDRRKGSTRGTRAAVSRPVSLNLNSDDEIIVSMKRKRISDKKIADRLKAEGRVNYSPKTIGTRFMRIRAKLAKARDEELDKGVITWSAVDDQNLLKAVRISEKNIDAMKAAAEKTKWDLTSRELSKMDLNGGYSTRACRERYEKLKSGKAVSMATPIELTPAQAEVKRLEDLIVFYNQKLTNAKADVDKEQESVATTQDGNDDEEEGEEEEEEGNSLRGNENMVPNFDPNFAPSSRAMDVDKDLTGMETWMLRSIRLNEQDAQAEKRLRGITFPPIEDMNSTELAAELLARGIARNGNKQKLEATVKAARAGNNGLSKSIVVPNVTPLKILLAKRADREAMKQKKATKEKDLESDEAGDNHKPAAKKRRVTSN